MGERREWTKERHGHAKLAAEESEARGYRMVPVSPDEMLTLLAEIERAWGEIEGLNEHLSIANTALGPIERDNERLTRRLAHAHDSASALYRAAGVVLARREADHGPAIEGETLEHGGPPYMHAEYVALRAAIDPALSAAAIAETQRRDGLDAEVRALTADRDEWKRIAEEQAAMLLTRGPAIGQEIDLSDGRKATITEAWSNGAGWYVDVRHLDGSKGRMAQEGGVWRASNGPALDSDGDPTPPPEMATTTGEDEEPPYTEDEQRIALRAGRDFYAIINALAFLRWVCGMVPRTIDLGSKTHVRADTGLTACGLFIEEGVRVAGHRRSYDCPACMAVSQ